MLLKLTQFFKKHQKDLVLLIFVILISLLSFAIGFIVAKQKEREPLRIEYYKNEKSKSCYYWRRDLRTIFSLEII